MSYICLMRLSHSHGSLVGLSSSAALFVCQKANNPQNSSCCHLRPLTFADFKLPHYWDSNGRFKFEQNNKLCGLSKGKHLSCGEKSGFFFNCQMFILRDSRLSPTCFSSSPMLNLNIIWKVYRHAWVEALNVLPTWNLFLLRKKCRAPKTATSEIQRCKCQV